MIQDVALLYLFPADLRRQSLVARHALSALPAIHSRAAEDKQADGGWVSMGIAVD